MTRRITIEVPLNRVEGDLELRVELQDGVVTEAWSRATLFRGFENLMLGRAALDGLVITPRICGICSTAHLMAAARALDRISGVAVPANAVRVRNLALMAEQLQSDVRQSILMYLADAAAEGWAGHPLSAQAVERYQPVRGTAALEAIRATRGIVELVALIGGQWPHSSFMVPGGIAHTVDIGDLVLCRHQLGQFRDWYERHILGCPLERWLAVGSAAELEGWLEDSDRHRQSELGFFLRWAKLAGLDRVGQGVGRFLSYGSLELPAGSAVTGSDGQWVAAGFVDALGLHPFDQREIAESTASSWYQATNGEALHPFAGETRPGVPTDDDGRYSWAKAPRYRDQPAETGPLAERMVASDPLFTDLVRRGGASAMTRQLARMVRPARVIPVMETWLAELMAEPDAPCYQPPPALETGRGCGLIQAARGALGHWVEIEDRQITRYQVITPSAWNGSPRDGSGQRGPWEQALIGLAVADPDDPVLLGSVVRSFDPCLVCTVHTLVRGRRPGRLRLA